MPALTTRATTVPANGERRIKVPSTFAAPFAERMQAGAGARGLRLRMTADQASACS